MAVPIDLIIQKKNIMKIPIGGSFCFTHLKSIKSTCTGGVPNDDPDNMCKDDDLYVPDEPNVSPKLEEGSFRTLSGINTLLGTSHVKFQVKRE